MSTPDKIHPEHCDCDRCPRRRLTARSVVLVVAAVFILWLLILAIVAGAR